MLNNELLTQYVRTATVEVFTTMLGMELVIGEARVEKSAPNISDGVLSLVGLAGTWTGAGTISCSSQFACLLCAQLLMTEATSVNEEVLDAVGELTNMIIGNFKTLVEEQTGPLGLSIPTVIFGHNFTSRSIGSGEWIAIPFHCGDEVFEIRVSLTPSKEPSTPVHGYSHPTAVA